MQATTQGVIELGFEGILVDIECHLSNGLPNIIIVGYASKAVDEAKERIRSAFANSMLELPRKRITINLAPADIPKDGSSLDLAIACSILGASGSLKERIPAGTIVIGELGLDGSARPVRGIIGKLLAAKKLGMKQFIIPTGNLPQAELIKGLSILPINSLKEIYLMQSGAKNKNWINTTGFTAFSSTKSKDDIDMSDIVGQTSSKRALEIAAAGGHNILMNGPPGTGKSMLAKALVSILPPLTNEESLEVTHIHSLSSPNFDEIVVKRPFRTPHHTASDTAIIGGGNNPRPGEISLSHRGILFFDELPEFNRSTLEALRQPLEDRVITVSRAKTTISFPANFMLVSTANPCPCGYYGTHRACTCLPQQIVKYQRKLSGPILDRIDIFTDVEHVEHKQLLSQKTSGETSQQIATRVRRARAIQALRFGSQSHTNSDMSSRYIKSQVKIDSEARHLLDSAAKKLELSPRSYMRTLKVAQTIADLNESPIINTDCIAEAIQYRPKKIAPL